MSFIDPKAPKIHLYSLTTSSYLPLHEHTLLLDIQVSLPSMLCHARLLFQHGYVGHLTSVIIVQSAQERKEGRGRPQGGWVLHLKSGCLVATGASLMSGHSWELAL